jgi:SAM-dependent methyltransferase
MSSWKDPAVAAGQREVIIGELAAFRKAWPFVQFSRAMESILAMAPERIETLLDVGCGCGHYGRVLEMGFPWIEYNGCDFSPYMVEIAKEICPQGHIWQCAFEDVELQFADIVLLSQVVEYTKRPFESLKRLREIPRWVILHKIRTTAKATHLINEATYAGHFEQCMLWNVTELSRQLWANSISVIGLPLKWDPGGDIVTLIGRSRTYA